MVQISKSTAYVFKHYYGGDTPPLVIPDSQTFPNEQQNSWIESSLINPTISEDSRVRFSLGKFRGTDKTKITRKPSKTGKHGHEERKSKKPEMQSQKQAKLKKTQGVSITDCHAGNPCELPSDLTANNDLPIIEELYGQDQKAWEALKGLESSSTSYK
ncbi:hypothetical protein Tco_0374579 [Tanacetum coccineum]